MIQEVKQFRITCDKCKESVIVEECRGITPQLPDGWECRHSHDLGPYPVSDDLCQKCATTRRSAPVSAGMKTKVSRKNFSNPSQSA